MTPLSEAQLLACVKESGFPFELEVARELVSMGFEVQLGYRFLDRSKKRDAEMDIIARESAVTMTQRGTPVRHSLRLVIECRDTSLPLVLFGVANRKFVPQTDQMDADWPFCWIDTSRDQGIPNKFSSIAFDESRSKLFRKRFHHQFDGDVRFSTVTTVEWEKKRPKLHVTDRLRSTLANFGAFVEDSRATWLNITSAADFEKMIGGIPTVELTFLLLVHSGEQYRYSSEGALIRSTRTSLFNTFHSERGVQFFVIDVVRSDDLQAAITRIRNTAGLLLDHVLPSVLASGGP